MRRRLPTLIPILLIAVLAQVLTPIGAFRAVASMLADPLGMTSICSGQASPDKGLSSDKGLSPDKGQPSQPDPAHADCCAVCAAGHSFSFATDTSTSRLIEPVRDVSQLVWRHATDASPVMRWRSPAQARGPPALA